MSSPFHTACYANNLEKVQNCAIPSQYELNKMFVYMCSRGYLEIAKYLYEKGADITCYNNQPFISACCRGHFNVAQWLYELGINVMCRDNEVFWKACSSGNISLAKWLIEIHYNKCSFIHFDNYKYFKLEIKNLLIDTNLVHPSQLEMPDLEYYLHRKRCLHK